MLRSLVARVLYGRRATRAVDAARRDLIAMPLSQVIGIRQQVPAGGRRRWFALRALNRALADVLAREGVEGLCLPRAVALLGEARRLGFAPRIVVGVQRQGGDLGGHAWLQLDGKPFLEAPSTPESFVEVYLSSDGGEQIVRRSEPPM